MARVTPKAAVKGAGWTLLGAALTELVRVLVDVLSTRGR